MHDDVAAMLDGAAEIRRGESGVDEERQAGVVRHSRHFRHVEDFEPGIADDLGKDGARKSAGRRGSTKVVAMPKRGSVSFSRLIEPP
jgi:hypothetical protein